MRKLRLAVLAWAGAWAVALAGLGGVALANWHDARPRDGVGVRFELPVIELAERTADGADWTRIDAVSALDRVLSIPFGPAEAAEVRALSEANLANGGEVIWTKAFKVSGTAHGTFGYGYTVNKPATAASGYGADLALVAVNSLTDCTAAALTQNWGNFPGQAAGSVDGNGLVTALARPDAVGVGYGAAKTDTQYYCLAAKYAPAPMKNEATASAEGSFGAASDTDSWSAYVYADPAKEAPQAFGLAVEFSGAN
ncbi:MAG: hypothetical protein LBD70_08635 [Bifidobacteriaceae bacterium]|jgi:hypothetical protein|nr:hypothetical protein [Bifidobacteriaceae bacterium]